MASEKLLTAAMDATIGVLSQDIGQVVNTLVKLVRHTRAKCDKLIVHVQSVDTAIRHIEQ